MYMTTCKRAASGTLPQSTGSSARGSIRTSKGWREPPERGALCVHIADSCHTAETNTSSRSN